jgi:hypothetical protein
MFKGRVIPPDAVAALFQPGVQVWSVDYTDARVSPLIRPLATPTNLAEVLHLPLPSYMAVQSWKRDRPETP